MSEISATLLEAMQNIKMLQGKPRTSISKNAEIQYHFWKVSKLCLLNMVEEKGENQDNVNKRLWSDLRAGALEEISLSHQRKISRCKRYVRL